MQKEVYITRRLIPILVTIYENSKIPNDRTIVKYVLYFREIE